MTILHIFGARANFLLFFDNQDTESYRQKRIGVDLPILTQKIIKGSFVQRYPYITTFEKNIVAILHFWGH